MTVIIKAQGFAVPESGIIDDTFPDFINGLIGLAMMPKHFLAVKNSKETKKIKMRMPTV